MIRSAVALYVVLLLASGFALSGVAQSRKKKKTEEEPVTQTLPVLKDPPGAVAAETARLVFHVSPLSNKGLLSQQVRDALKVLMRDTHGAQIVKLRAFTAGSGDLRRVPQIVSEVFTEKKLDLPAVSSIESGGLPMEGAQVVFESVSVEKKTMNPNGLAFFSGPVAKNVRDALSDLRASVKAAGVRPEEVLRVTCFVSALDDVAGARTTMSALFPSAAANLVETQRLAVEPLAECESVGRLESAPAQMVSIAGEAALVNSPKIVLTGTQMAFRDQEADLRLAYDRMGRILEPLGATYKDVFLWSGYALTKPIAEKMTAVGQGLVDRSRPPVGKTLLFEGLPSLDATMAIEVMAAAK